MFKKFSTYQALGFLILAVSLSHSGVAAATLALGPVFSQDFESSSSVGDYDNGGDNQFDSIGGSGSTPSIQSGAFQISMPIGDGNIGHATRTVTDFDGPPEILVFRADVTLDNLTSDVVDNVGNNAAVTFQFGDNVDQTTSSPQVSVFSTFYLASNSDGTIYLRSGQSGNVDVDVAAGTTLSVSFFMNNSGASADFLAPDGSTLTLGNDQVSLWSGTTLAKTYDASAVTQDLTSFGVYAQSYAIASRNIGYDFVMDDMEFQVAIPEPSTMSLIFAGALTCLWFRRSNLRKSRCREFMGAGPSDLSI